MAEKSVSPEDKAEYEIYRSPSIFFLEGRGGVGLLMANLTSCLTAKKKKAETITIKVWYPFWRLGMFSLQWHCISVAMKTCNVCSIPRLIKLDDTTTPLLHNDINNNKNAFQ